MICIELILMVFGGVLALGGLVLLFQKRELGKNRIKIFGQEVEISRSALLVLPEYIPYSPSFDRSQLDKEGDHER